MEINGLVNLASNMAQSRTEEAVSMAVLKKSMDVQANSAAALLQTMPAPVQAPNLPPHLGQNINTTA